MGLNVNQIRALPTDELEAFISQKQLELQVIGQHTSHGASERAITLAHIQIAENELDNRNS